MNKIQFFLCTAILVLGFGASVQAAHRPVLRPASPPPTPVPEPVSIALLGGGLVGLYGLKKKFGKD